MDRLYVVAVSTAGAVAFGLWQHSISAGTFATVLLFCLARIAWNTEFLQGVK